jgi:hypothetical protein
MKIVRNVTFSFADLALPRRGFAYCLLPIDSPPLGGMGVKGECGNIPLHKAETG